MADSPHKADDEKEPCEPGEDNRKSDLCAQWKAADAAADSARWTRLTFVASLFGLGIALLTLAAAAAAAIYARFAALHSDRSATAAIAANSLAQETFLVERRAYIFASDFHIEQAPGPKEQRIRDYIVTFKWNNSGQTWPKRLYTYASVAVMEGELSEEFSYPDIEGWGMRQVVFIPSGTQFESTPVFASHADMTRVAEGRAFLYVWGWCEYNDVMPGTPRRRTEFCMRSLSMGIVIPVTEEAPGEAAMRWQVYGPHNAADEDCVKAPQT
ncbi:hypothetical protein [Methylobacterium sp. E-045]|uniref:hypothetical protein n=1 Tax=Methylobacterium sp. E-045 TaxID=2836575 RepID=UPI001FB919AD|nr:hypothetical protein [Methylobacterium sp. E-045]MCJ2128038.1 hypothetical protein [Methylobacterium sp. E-045]